MHKYSHTELRYELWGPLGVTEQDSVKVILGVRMPPVWKLSSNWQGGRVIYFGDHLAADLADVTLHHGWKTAAVIRSDPPFGPSI